MKYIDIFKIDNEDTYVFQNACGQKITTKGIEYILKNMLKNVRKNIETNLKVIIQIIV